MDNEKKIVAAFDFDGTITTKDTLFDFIAFYKGKAKLIGGLIVLSPVLVLYKAGLIKNSFAKQILFSWFFKGENSAVFGQKCSQYAIRISSICKPSVLDKINWHQQNGHSVLIVSASIDRWIRPWAHQMGIPDVLGTIPEEKEGKLTGKFRSENCYGKEKVNRLLSLFPDKESYTLYAYGDSNGDKQLLELADYPHFIRSKD